MTYDNGEPQTLSMGHPTHGLVREGNFNYFYTIVNKGMKGFGKGEENSEVMIAVLTSLSGNSDLYLSVEDNPSTKDLSNWKLPT
ncbi:MAG: hypothetical protein ACMG6E_08210 [Candidatus Roizmanbacteria bacterium]